MQRAQHRAALVAEARVQVRQHPAARAARARRELRRRRVPHSTPRGTHRLRPLRCPLPRPSVRQRLDAQRRPRRRRLGGARRVGEAVLGVAAQLRPLETERVGAGARPEQLAREKEVGDEHRRRDGRRVGPRRREERPDLLEAALGRRPEQPGQQQREPGEDVRAQPPVAARRLDDARRAQIARLAERRVRRGVGVPAERDIRRRHARRRHRRRERRRPVELAHRRVQERDAAQLAPRARALAGGPHHDALVAVPTALETVPLPVIAAHEARAHPRLHRRHPERSRIGADLEERQPQRLWPRLDARAAFTSSRRQLTCWDGRDDDVRLRRARRELRLRAPERRRQCLRRHVDAPIRWIEGLGCAAHPSESHPA